MKLTINNIKQLVKEELNRLLNENKQSVETLAKKFLERTKAEPQAWKQEYSQYVAMLEQGLYEELFNLLESEQVGHEIFAYMLESLGNGIDSYIGDEEEKILENFPNLYNLYKQKYIGNIQLVKFEDADLLRELMDLIKIFLDDYRSYSSLKYFREENQPDDFDDIYVDHYEWYYIYDDEYDDKFSTTQEFETFFENMLLYLINRVGAHWQSERQDKVTKLFEKETGISFPFKFNGFQYNNLGEVAWFILDLYYQVEYSVDNSTDRFSNGEEIISDIFSHLGKTLPSTNDPESSFYDSDGFGGFFWYVVIDYDRTKPL